MKSICTFPCYLSNIVFYNKSGDILYNYLLYNEGCLARDILILQGYARWDV